MFLIKHKSSFLIGSIGKKGTLFIKLFPEFLWLDGNFRNFEATFGVDKF